MVDKTEKKPSFEGEHEVQKKVDEETSQGFRGVEVDPTPNENYTVAGVTSGAPTPETDRDHYKKVRNHVEAVQAKTDGVSGQGN